MPGSKSSASRPYVEYRTGESCMVPKSKQRLARCRFVMLYSSPPNVMVSKGLPLSRIDGLDLPGQPAYGLSEGGRRGGLAVAAAAAAAALLFPKQLVHLVVSDSHPTPRSAVTLAALLCVF